MRWAIKVEENRVNSTKLKLEKLWKCKVNERYFEFESNFIGVFIAEEDNVVFETDDANFTIISGLVRTNRGFGDITSCVLNSNDELFDHLHGNFSCITFSSSTGKFILNTDWVGFLPIYYMSSINLFSSSLLAISSLSNAGFDAVGLAQRMATMSHYNLGDRTIIRGCKRLLGGESITVVLNSLKISSFFRKGLYNINNDESLEEAALRASALIKNEWEQLLDGREKVNIALSSGVDSRLALGSIPAGKSVKAHIYGENHYYEVRRAVQLAEAINADFEVYPVESVLFPDIATIEDYVRKTEAVEVNNWFAILNSVKKSKELLVLGDLCEAINGRYIKPYRSKWAQIKSFITQYVFLSDLTFTVNNSVAYKEWRNKQISSLNVYKIRPRFEALGITENEYIEASMDDLHRNFNFIEAQEIPYVELLDESLGWHTSRAKQLLLMQSKFFSVSPMNSTRIMQLVSSIHPKYRLNYRLLHKIFREDDSYKRINKIPTAQIPFIPFASPNWLKLLIWGLRGFADWILLKYMMITKSPFSRDLLLNWIPFPQLYQKKENLETLRGWFSTDSLDLKNVMVDYFEAKRNLKRKPIYNFHETCMAALNAEVNIITKTSKQI